MILWSSRRRDLESPHVVPGQRSFESTRVDVNGFVRLRGPLDVHPLNGVCRTAHSTPEKNPNKVLSRKFLVHTLK